MENVSLITLVKGRKAALINLITGLTNGTRLPNELIIVFMNETPYQLPNVDFTIHTIGISDTNNIPLAKARNLGVKASNFDKLIFLDVDCVPAKDLVERYSEDIDEVSLMSGRIRYLNKTAINQTNWFTKMDSLSNPDLIRSNISKLSYELFWSLNFGCSKKVFDKIGGFNESYQGYGAEDTDFAFKAREKEILLLPIKATAYHQYHDSYDPPLNHFEDIVKNATLFHKLWHKWPMEGWLKKFSDLGLIDWGDEIHIIRKPTKEEIAKALK